MYSLRIIKGGRSAFDGSCVRRTLACFNGTLDADAPLRKPVHILSSLIVPSSSEEIVR